MQMKSWYKSKTIIALQVPLAILGLAIIALPEFQAVIDSLPIQYIGLATLFVSIVGTILRFVTKQPIE
jgi:hypothetical protein